MRRPFTLEYWIDDGWFVGRLENPTGLPRGSLGLFATKAFPQELSGRVQDFASAGTTPRPQEGNAASLGR